MSTEHVVRWMCDRCGKREYATPGCFPMDWKRVDIHDYLEGITEDALCPECAEEFIPKWKNFMKEVVD